MTVTLPADSDTERLARKLAETTGKSLPTVVREAIEARAQAVGISQDNPDRLAKDELLARMIKITEEFAHLPVIDNAE